MPEDRCVAGCRLEGKAPDEAGVIVAERARSPTSASAAFTTAASPGANPAASARRAAAARTAGVETAASHRAGSSRPPIATRKRQRLEASHCMQPSAGQKSAAQESAAKKGTA